MSTKSTSSSWKWRAPYRKPGHYQSLDMFKAVATGWGHEHKLSMSELQVLAFIATKGHHTQGEDLLFRWSPPGGQGAWALDLGLSERVLERALAGLRSKGLVIDVPKGHPGRFADRRSYAIPSHVMKVCLEWNDTHYYVGPTPASVVAGVELREQLAQSESRVGSTRRRKRPSPTLMSAAPDDRVVRAPGLTRGNGGTQEATQERNPGENHSLTGAAQPLGSPAPISVPSHPTPEHHRDEDDSLEVSQSGHQASWRLAGDFRRGYLSARSRFPEMAEPWNSKAGCIAMFKTLLEDHTEEEIGVAIESFFACYGGPQISRVGDELWKQFINSRAEVFRHARASGKWPHARDDDDWEARNLRNREIMRIRRSERESREARLNEKRRRLEASSDQSGRIAP